MQITCGSFHSSQCCADVGRTFCSMDGKSPEQFSPAPAFPIPYSTVNYQESSNRTTISEVSMPFLSARSRKGQDVAEPSTSDSVFLLASRRSSLCSRMAALCQIPMRPLCKPSVKPGSTPATYRQPLIPAGSLWCHLRKEEIISARRLISILILLL